MSDEAPNGQPRHGQADELIRELRANTIAVGALALAVGALVLAVKSNTKAIESALADDEHDEDCEDEECDGECLELDELPPPRKRARKR